MTEIETETRDRGKG